jgi:hypothetical protein
MEDSQHAALVTGDSEASHNFPILGSHLGVPFWGVGRLPARSRVSVTTIHVCLVGIVSLSLDSCLRSSRPTCTSSGLWTNCELTFTVYFAIPSQPVCDCITQGGGQKPDHVFSTSVLR